MRMNCWPWAGLLGVIVVGACGEENRDYEGDQAGECSDLGDNDHDGLFDCDDPDCFGSPECGGGDADADADSSGDDGDDGGTTPCTSPGIIGERIALAATGFWEALALLWSGTEYVVVWIDEGPGTEPDFAFQLTAEEFSTLRSQNATLDAGRGKHRKYLPLAFTEHGAVMAASVLSSAKAVDMSIAVVRAFVRLREFLSAHRQLAAKFAELERKLATHDRHIVVLFDTIRALMAPPAETPRRIGFRPPRRGGPDAG